jgi:phosphopantothenoylcysteine decarboxylase/phosphopantothenate--cysteine ligase
MRFAMQAIKGKAITLGVTGCIAAYKAADITRRLMGAGADVKVIMTEAATHFITPLTFEKLSRNPVATGLFQKNREDEIPHISLAQESDAILIAPATANIMAKIAHGIADDLLTTTVLACQKKVILAPAMNKQMYLNPVTQDNLILLRGRGFGIVEPSEGELVCGEKGIGRLAETDQIMEALEEALATSRDFEGLKLLVSAGGTQEALDPVRFIGNRSSGKMGYALAEAAIARGAKVTLVAAPTALPVPEKSEFMLATSAEQMRNAIIARFAQVDVVIMAAAVSDYRVAHISEEKIKKQARLVLELVAAPDILEELGRTKNNQLLVGFAAESGSLVANAKEKLNNKNLDMVVANNILQRDAGIGKDDNAVTIIDRRGKVEQLPTLPKHQVAQRILDEVLLIMNERKNK